MDFQRRFFSCCLRMMMKLALQNNLNKVDWVWITLFRECRYDLGVVSGFTSRQVMMVLS